jgi:hypothetical protein
MMDIVIMTFIYVEKVREHEEEVRDTAAASVC